MQERTAVGWRRVVFVDWHGVLSVDPFWHSILHSRQHPVRKPLEAALRDLFADNDGALHEWMTGRQASAEVIASLGLRLPARYGEDFLLRRLMADIRQMQVSVELVAALEAWRDSAAIVVATDNMDCLVDGFHDIRRRAARPVGGSATLADWAAWFDDMICSSEMGTLKGTDPAAFFGPWLAAQGLTFGDALLIDDRADNCAAFTGAGGAALQWGLGSDPLAVLSDAVGGWARGGAACGDDGERR